MSTKTALYLLALLLLLMNMEIRAQHGTGGQDNLSGDQPSAYSGTNTNDLPTIVINEIQASNNATLSDEDGDYEDWIELYNTGVDSVDVGWFGLSDDYGRPFRWIIPPGSRIAPGGHLLIWASGKDRITPGQPLHTNFSIAQAGEEVLLTDIQGRRVDEVSPTRIPSDFSYGRYPDGSGSWHFFASPTPGSENTDPEYDGQVGDPVFSRNGGFYEGPFYLRISHHPDETIHYTLDGTEPTPDDPVFPDSLEISVREPHEQLLSFIPTTPPEAIDNHQHGWVKPEEPPFLATVLRVRSFRENSMPSPIITHTYFVASDSLEPVPTSADPYPDTATADERSTTESPGAAAFRDHASHATDNQAGKRSRYPLPVISLVTDSLHLFDHVDGIYIPGKRYEDHWYNPPWGSPYANYFNRGDAWERPASFEFFDPDDGRVFSQDIGIRIHGGMSRAMPMKSLRLYARSEYGERRFEFPFFDHPDSHPEYDPTGPGNAGAPPSYNRLILRNSGQDFYRGGAATMFRDAMIQGLVSHLKMDTQAYRPTVLFINGEFWGIINIRERYDKHYLARTYSIDPERIDYLTSHTTINEGNRDHYLEYRSYLSGNDMSDDEHYAHINTMLDVDNFLDYNISNIYANNRDWPANNRDMFRYQTDYNPDAQAGRDGRWRYMLVDTDFGFGFVNRWDDVHHNMLAIATGRQSRDNVPNPPWSTEELRKLLENNEFRNRFINRFVDYLNTHFSPEYVLSHIDHYRNLLEPVIGEHILRWNHPPSKNAWDSHIRVMNDFAEKRPFHVREHIMEEFGLDDTLQVTLDFDGPNRAGYLTINETSVNGHTRGIADNPYPWSGIYFHDVPITITATPRSGYRFAGWAEFPGHEEPRMELNPDSDVTITAIFEVDESPDDEPKPFNLADGPFAFDYWPPYAPRGSFPDHMLFQYMDRIHPGPDAFVSGNIDMAYNRESGTRVVGLGSDGIALMNSDTDADTADFHENRLGAVVVGLRTINHGHIHVNWSAETLQPNDRDYAIRLEFRVGNEGPFEPVTDDRNLPVIYKRDNGGTLVSMGPVTLPPEADDQPYVQLMWRYYDDATPPADPDTSPPKMRIDNIYVTSEPVSATAAPDKPDAFRLSQNYPNPFNQQTVLPYELPREGRVTVAIYSIDGRQISRYEQGHQPPGSHTLPINMEGWASGVYLVHMQVITGNGEVLFRDTRRMTLLK